MSIMQNEMKIGETEADVAANSDKIAANMMSIADLAPMGFTSL